MTGVEPWPRRSLIDPPRLVQAGGVHVIELGPHASTGVQVKPRVQ